MYEKFIWFQMSQQSIVQVAVHQKLILVTAIFQLIEIISSNSYIDEMVVSNIVADAGVGGAIDIKNLSSSQVESRLLN